MNNKIYIGIGSNVGDSISTINKPINLILSEEKIKFVAVSNFFLSKPIGYRNQPNFINAVICIKSTLTSLKLLKILLEIENQCGRKRSFKNAPRSIDLDLLIFKSLKVQLKGPPKLIIPHPQMHRRAFVLKPLIEIDPNCIIPGLGQASIKLKNCHSQKIECFKQKPLVDLINN